MARLRLNSCSDMCRNPRWILALLALLMSWARLACGTDFTEGSAFCTENDLYTFSGPSTNPIVGTNFIEAYDYHTFYFITTSNLNGLIYAVDFSPDQTNWIAWSTNTLAATASATLTTITNANFRQSYYRIRITGTNYYGKVVYLGGI